MLFSRQSRSFQNDAEVSDCLNFDTGTLRKRSDLHAGAGWQVLFEKLGVRRVYGRKHGQVCDKMVVFTILSRELLACSSTAAMFRMDCRVISLISSATSAPVSGLIGS